MKIELGLIYLSMCNGLLKIGFILKYIVQVLKIETRLLSENEKNQLSYFKNPECKSYEIPFQKQNEIHWIWIKICFFIIYFEINLWT